MSTELRFYEKYPAENGIYILSPVKNNFENLYIKVRSKEKRVYPDEEIKLLPFASEKNPHKKEWELRAKSFLRFKEYLSTKNENLNILDLGSGNGWFCGQLSKIYNHHYHCVDVNLTELKQAKKIFGADKLKFIYADIFSVKFPHNYFNLITINAAIQYFPSLKELTGRLLDLIKPDGEIHILDSPFYQDDEVKNAKERTEKYYTSINFPEMAKCYHHHTFNRLSEFNSTVKYNPDSVKKYFKKLLLIKDSPFPWILIKR